MGRSKMTFIKVAQIVIVLCFLPIIKPAASKYILVETKGTSDYPKERKADRDFPFSEESCPPESPKYEEPCSSLGQECMYGYRCCCGKCSFGVSVVQCVGLMEMCITALVALPANSPKDRFGNRPVTLSKFNCV